ncbi:MAG: hypothetical protein WKG01_05845 [Kofleriaceae bacterium]
MTREPIGTIASLNASLTLVVFDARAATEWIPTKPAATKAQFTGHPAEVMRGLGKGEETTTVDVGADSGYAFELEGKSGQIEVYRLDDDSVALVAPPRAWWQGDVAAIESLFADALETMDDATEVGPLELPSGKLAAVYLWLKKVGAARDLAATVSAGASLAFGDGYGEGNGGLVVDVGTGTHTLLRREIEAPWDRSLSLVVMYLRR